MKRWLFLIAMIFLLSGCAAAPEETLPSSEPVQTTVAPVTEPTGYYDPSSALEADTEGAVRVYPLNRTDSYAIVVMDSDLLLLSGKESTTLTRLSGSNLYVSAAANLGCYVDADSPAFSAGEKGITYYDTLHQELVYLDSSLSEVSRSSLPSDILGEPALTADRKNLYYCTTNTIRAINLDSGLDKLLKEMPDSNWSLSALHCNDSILEISVTDDQGAVNHLFVSTQTGETLLESKRNLSLTTLDHRYFATLSLGEYQYFLTGTADGNPQSLLSNTYGLLADPVLEVSSAAVCTVANKNTTLDLYDLNTGLKCWELCLPGTQIPHSYLGSSSENCVWFLRYDENYECDILCRWDLALTTVQDDTAYLTSYYDLPNEDEFAACQENAAILSQTYGVDILLTSDATACQPAEFILTPENQVPVIQKYLEILGAAFSKYPEGFLAQAASGTTCGRIQLCLVREIASSGNQSTDGIQFWGSDGNAYVVISMQDGLEQALYRELFHVIDSWVMSNCSVYDTWESLNPKGFSYTYSSELPQDEVSDLLNGSSRAFVDMESMTYPREDRARVMAMAMTGENEEIFESDIMQKKLALLCKGIRKAFGLRKSPDIFSWEHYLN